jgi:hypothetical protein
VVVVELATNSKGRYMVLRSGGSYVEDVRGDTGIDKYRLNHLAGFLGI